MMLDLYAGFGGQSEAFLTDGWEVLRIDNNPLLSGVDRMVITDIKLLTPSKSDQGRIEYVHASPPCNQFSRAFSAIAPTMQREGKHFNPDMSLVFEAIRLIEALNPKWWSIENVRGAIPFIEPILGPPRQIIGSYVYWGNFPFVEIDKSTLRTKHEKDKRHSGALRANHRAHIDLPISEAFLLAMKSQKCITDFF